MVKRCGNVVLGIIVVGVVIGVLVARPVYAEPGPRNINLPAGTKLVSVDVDDQGTRTYVHRPRRPDEPVETYTVRVAGPHGAYVLMIHER